MKIEVIVEKTKTGYSAYAEKYPVFTVGSSLEELKQNILEALNLFFEKRHKPKAAIVTCSNYGWQLYF